MAPQVVRNDKAKQKKSRKEMDKNKEEKEHEKTTMQMRLEGPIFKGLSFTFTFDQIYRLVY
jgi:hypothetical protein